MQHASLASAHGRADRAGQRRGNTDAHRSDSTRSSGGPSSSPAGPSAATSRSRSLVNLKEAEVSTVTLLDTIALGDVAQPRVDERQLTVLYHLSMMGAPQVRVVAGQLGDAQARAGARPGTEAGVA
jgi:hypothetical protein